MQPTNETTPAPTMAEPTQNTAPTPAPEAHKSSKAPWAVAAVTSVLAVAGIAFGVYGMMKPTEAPAPKTETTEDTEEPPKDSSNTKQTITVSEVEKLLKDKFQINPVQNTLWDEIVSTYNNFDESAKIIQTIKLSDNLIDQEKEYSSNEPSYTRKVSYSTLNNEYKKLFSEKDLEKKDYNFDAITIKSMKYNKEDDGFMITYADGLGGVSFIDKITKVVDVSENETGFKATVVTAIIDRMVIQEEIGPANQTSMDDGNMHNYIIISDKDMNAIYETISQYEFNFIGSDGEYKLISINAI